MPYYCCFIFEYAHTAKPLHEVTESGKEFLWIEACDKGFCTLKENLVSTPVLAFPTLDGMLILDRDASGVAIGAFLSQVQNGNEKVIAYFSRALRRVEINYCYTSWVTCCDGWDLAFPPLLVWKEVHCRNWTWRFAVAYELQGFGTANGMMVRNLDNEVVYLPGAKHGYAGALLRQPCSHGESGFCNRIEAGHKPI